MKKHRPIPRDVRAVREPPLHAFLSFTGHTQSSILRADIDSGRVEETHLFPKFFASGEKFWKKNIQFHPAVHRERVERQAKQTFHPNQTSGLIQPLRKSYHPYAIIP